VLTDDLPSAERKEMDPLDGLYDQEDERGRLLRLFAGRYASMLRAVNDLLERSVGVPAGTFRLDDPAVRHFILTQAVTRVVRIDDTTQTALRAAIAAGQELGLSSWEIANGTADGSFPGIEGLFAETWRSRHVTVARTELQYAQLAASIDRFRASGIVAGVTARDGGTTDSDSLCNGRNGRFYPMSVPPPDLAHPRCTLVVVPTIDENLFRQPLPVDDTPPAS
jgi:hypothetical protein